MLIYLKISKNEVLNMFLKDRHKNQKDKKIKILKSDRCGVYILDEFTLFYKEHDIIH